MRRIASQKSSSSKGSASGTEAIHPFSLLICPEDTISTISKDENGNFVCINDFTKENIIGHVYKCPACGCEMRPRLGLKNKHHFYHKGESCEGYLHEVAKLLIKDIFDRSERFYIALEKYCDRKNDCPFVEKLNCSHVLTHFNLKDYYDTCSIETRVEDGFIPDVIYSSLRGGAYMANVISEYFKIVTKLEKLHPALYAGVVGRSYSDIQQL